MRISLSTKKMVLAALFMAIGLVLPFLTGQIPSVGNMLLPMHIPVLLCGFICGWPYGLLVGFILPLLRSTLFGMPPMIPIAVAMAFELATYGLLSGLLYKVLPRRKGSILLALVVAMLGGRIVWGIASLIIFGLQGMPFTWGIFMAGAFLNAIPGIVIQIVLIPLVLVTLREAKFLGNE